MYITTHRRTFLAFLKDKKSVLFFLNAVILHQAYFMDLPKVVHIGISMALVVTWATVVKDFADLILKGRGLKVMNALLGLASCALLYDLFANAESFFPTLMASLFFTLTLAHFYAYCITVHKYEDKRLEYALFGFLSIYPFAIQEAFMAPLLLMAMILIYQKLRLKKLWALALYVAGVFCALAFYVQESDFTAITQHIGTLETEGRLLYAALQSLIMSGSFSYQEPLPDVLNVISLGVMGALLLVLIFTRKKSSRIVAVISLVSLVSGYLAASAPVLYTTFFLAGILTLRMFNPKPEYLE